MASVKQKVAAIERERGELRAGVRKIETSVSKLKSDIRGQERTNSAAVHTMDAGTRKLQEAIKELGRINAAAAREIDAGSKKIQAKARRFEEEIAKKSGEVRHYMREFYFGEGKK